MEKMYYYRNGDQQYGPVSIDQMRGVVTPDTYVWAEGMANWQTVSQVPELMSQLGLAVAYQQPTMQEPQPSYQTSYQTSYQSNDGSNGVKPPKPNNHLVLSIISILLSCMVGIVALIFSLLSDSDYKKGDYKGAEEKAKVAKIVAIVGIVLGGLYWAFNILTVVLAIGAGAVQTY